jgi:pimeloyl-ACP methyl ester carboxylesterase
VVDTDKTVIVQEEFIREQASLRGDEEAVNELNNTEEVYFEKWLFKFGGELKKSKSFFPLIWSGLQAPEYTLSDALKIASGSSFSSSNMKKNILSESIYNEIREYNVPVYFFVGSSDYVTPHELVTEYFQMVSSPEKEIVYFENSAHFPFYEEPERFCNEMNRVLTNN